MGQATSSEFTCLVRLDFGLTTTTAGWCIGCYLCCHLALIALATTASGSQRIGIAPLILLFLIGLFLLSFVKPKGEMTA